jgi:hypothetical protein
MPSKKSKTASLLFISGGLLFLLLALGFSLQLSWAQALWPWPEGRLSYLFIGAIMAAIAAPVIWIGLSGEYGAARGGAIDLAIAASGTAIYLFYLYSQNQDPQILVTAVLFALFVPLNIFIYLWSRHIPIRDQREKPIMVDFFLIFFVIVLVLVGWGLLRQSLHVFPWHLKPESSILFGLLFIGTAAYFFTALRMSRWHAARGQLLSFLAFDLVLIGPFLSYFDQVTGEHRSITAIYIAVILVSALLAIYYLFVDKSTRSWLIDENPHNLSPAPSANEHISQ